MKQDLSNATFIIPIRIESSDRLRNVITSVCYLNSMFNTTIMIHEMDGTPRFRDEALPQIKEFCDGDIDQIKYEWENNDNPHFHRQRILNDMLMRSKTKIVINYDCDILLPIKSYLFAYKMIMDDKAHVVYPYGDGNYQRQVFATDTLVSKFLNENFDLSVLGEKSKPFMAKYGFVQFFNRGVYIEGGMENENFVAYAPEDAERYHRFKSFGYNVQRIDNLVYHLEHSRTINSSLSNPFMANNNGEWEKARHMSPDEYKKYLYEQSYYKRRVG